MNAKSKKALVGIAALAMGAGIFVSLAFTTTRIDGDLALITKLFRRQSLQAGDFVFVEVENPAPLPRAAYRLEAIYPPDPTTRPQVGKGRNPLSRHLAQAILDMDFKPKYSVTVLGQATNPPPIIINEPQIKGKIIKVFGHRSGRPSA